MKSRCVIPFAMVFVSAACLAQSAETNDRTNADDLKGIRSSLEHLIQMTGELEKTQKAILEVQQLQLYEFRLQALETRDDVLDERENELSTRSVTLERAARETASGVGPTGLPGTSSDAIRKETSDQLDGNQRSLDGIRAKRQRIQREIATLRARIESLHKSLAAAGVEN